MSVCSFCLVVPLQTLRSVEKVRMKGLEPPRPESLDPKSNAATNYATCAGFFAIAKLIKNFHPSKFSPCDF